MIWLLIWFGLGAVGVALAEWRMSSLYPSTLFPLDSREVTVMVVTVLVGPIGLAASLTWIVESFWRRRA